MTLAFPHLWIPARNILSPAADWLAATSSALRTRPANSAQRNRCGDAAMEMQDPSCCGGCACSASDGGCSSAPCSYTVTVSGVTIIATTQKCCSRGFPRQYTKAVGASVNGTYSNVTHDVINNCRWQQDVASGAGINRQDLDFSCNATGSACNGNGAFAVSLSRVISTGKWRLTVSPSTNTTCSDDFIFFVSEIAITGANDCTRTMSFTNINAAFTCSDTDNNSVAVGFGGSATATPN
jgi:hypothetical protein